MTSLIDRIAEEQKAKEEQALAAFAAVVWEIANGNEPKADVRRVLLDTGKSVEDLRAAVAHKQRRIELARKVAERDAAQEEQAEVNKKAEAARKKLEAAQEAYDNAIAPLDVRQRSIDRRLNDAHHAESALLQSCDDQKLIAAQAALNRQIAETRAFIATKAEELRRAKAISVPAIEVNVRNYPKGHRVHAEAAEQLAYYRETKLPGYERTIAEAEAKLSELQRQLADVIEQMRQP